MSKEAKFTEGELIVEESEYSKEFEVHQKDSDDCFYVVAEGISNVSDAHLIAAAPDMYRMLETLTCELNAAIDEVNTMRDINNSGMMTPADHWDKESCHDAQLTLAKARGEA